jgi:hypothetical protein
MKNFFIALTAFLFVLNINAQNLLDNPSFEGTWNAMLGTPADWTTTAGRTSQETAIVKDALSACRINGNNSAKLEQQIPLSSSYQAGAIYEIRFWYYVVSSTASYDIQMNSSWTGAGVETTHDEAVLKQTFSASTIGQWEEKVIQTSMQTSPAPSSISFNFSIKVPTGVTAIFDDISFQKIENTQPFINVSPTSLTPVSTTVNVQTQFQTLTVTTENLTDAVDIYITGGDAQYFSLTPSITQIPAGQTSTTLTVNYLPTEAGNHQAMLSFDYTTTPSINPSVIALHGSAANPALQPSIQITPTSYNFGTLQIGEAATANFTVTTENLTEFPNTSLINNGEPHSCITISSGSAGKNVTSTITVRFSPTAERDYTKQLTITANGITAAADIYGSGEALQPCSKEGDPYPVSLSTENPHSLLNETFDNQQHNQPLNISGWKNIAENNCRAWWGYRFEGTDRPNYTAKATAYNSVDEAADPYEMWLYTPPLDFANAQTKKFTFRVMGDFLLEEDLSVLELYYVVKNPDGSPDTTLIEINDFPSISDENGIWYPYIVNLDDLNDDIFFMAFRYYCPEGGKLSSQVYYIDDVTWGQQPSGLNEIDDNSIKVFADKNILNIVSDKSGTAILYDASGRATAEYNFVSGQNNFAHNLKSGMYIIQIQHNKGFFTKKISL